MTGARTKQGFTIIEVAMVVAITGLLFAALALSVQGTLRRSRYNDSVTSAQDIIATQYDLVQNVQNVRTQTAIEGCRPPASNAADVPAGMTDCLVYGRGIWIEYRGQIQLIHISNIIGDNSVDEALGDELQIFRSLNLRLESEINDAATEFTQLTWGAEFYNPTPSPNNPPHVVMGTTGERVHGGFFLLRSPASGNIWTYPFSGVWRGAMRRFFTNTSVDNPSSDPGALCIRSNDVNQNLRRAILVGWGGPLSGGSNATGVQLAPVDVETNGVPPVNCRDA